MKALLAPLWRDPGLSGLYLFAATLHCNRALAAIGCLAMLYPLVQPGSEARRVLPRLALYHWLLWLAIYALLRALLAMFEDPAEAVNHGGDALRFVYWVGVLAVAWQLDGDSQRLLRVLVVALIGFLLGRLWHLPDLLAVEASDWLLQRPGLGLEPIGLGYYAGCALLGLLLLLPRSLQAVSGTGARLALGAAAGAALLFLLQCVLWSQSRGAWLSLLPCLAVAIGWLLCRRRGPAVATGRVLAALCLIGLLAGIAVERDTLRARLFDEASTLRAIAGGEWEHIRSGNAAGHNFSIGTRVNMLRAGLDAARQRPLLGSGPASPRLLLADHEDPILRRWNDFHNAPVDLLVRFGVVGLLLVAGAVAATLYYALGQAFHRAYCADLRLALWLGLALLLLSSLTNFRLLNYDWRYWLFLFAGATASPRLAALRRSAHRASSPVA